MALCLLSNGRRLSHENCSEHTQHPLLMLALTQTHTEPLCRMKGRCVAADPAEGQEARLWLNSLILAEVAVIYLSGERTEQLAGTS